MKKSCRSGYWAMAWLLLSLMLTITSCIREEEFDNTPQGNFEALWQMIDEHYCFFDYKQNEYGLDWNEVRDRYAPLITPDMPQKGLFEVLGNMLAELRDGHVNLYTTYDVARYWKWYEDYPANFNDSIQRRYLGTNYKIAGGLKYTILDDNIAYVYYESFSTGIGDGNLSEMLNELAFCNGLILDVRNNGGGMLTNATKLAARFTNEEVTTGYMCHKTGTGHNDFSSPEAVKITPSDGVRWQKPVAL
ncbi:MAG: peptidase S41, partial [Bacteroidaceae bacterium]|nr:peptidase S41 [Bacteroidaceae bacterium]